jgi:phage terminase large subunit
VRTAALAWHRRAGKDDIALHNAACKAMQRVGNYWHMLPMQEQARKALWEAVNPKTGKERWRDAFPEEIIEHVDNQGMKLKLKNNSTWQLLGSDNYNSLVGTTPVGMTLSEAALADPNAFEFFSPILLENNGWSVHISSTRGRNHFYRFFKLLESDPEAFAQHLSAHDTDVFTAQQLAAELRRYISRRGQKRGEALFKQEYLSDWDAAVIGAVFGDEISTLRAQNRAQRFVWDPRFPVDTSWDIGVGDPTVILFWQQIGNRYRLIDWYSATATGLDHFAEVLSKKPYLYRNHIGPHDIAVREFGLNGVSRMSRAKQLGINFQRMPNIPKVDSIALAANLINLMEINVHEEEPLDPMDDCTFVLDALTGYRFKYDEERDIMSKDTVHDWTSHYADALATYAIFISDKLMASIPAEVQGLQGQTYNNIRVRDLMARSSSSPGVKGAFG